MGGEESREGREQEREEGGGEGGGEGEGERKEGYQYPESPPICISTSPLTH